MALPNLINPEINKDSILLNYNEILKTDKIINIPNFISTEILSMAKPLLENYRWWEYSIRNSNKVKEYNNLNDPSIVNELIKCKNEFNDLVFSYRFKKSVYKTHYAECKCIVCSLSKSIICPPFTDILSKIIGCEVIIPGEIFFSNYGENDYLNLHHDINKGDIAVTISFTYDWHPTYGGILHFTDNDNNIYKSVVPRPGDLNIFLLEENKGLNHFVSTVTSNKNRYMITAWYNKRPEIIKNPSQNIYFCSFATEPIEGDDAAGRRLNIKCDYHTAAIRIKRQAEEARCFTSVCIYNQLNTPGLEKYSEFIKNSTRLYGYGVWKPLLILDMMKKSEPNSIIVYSDSGCEVIMNNSTIELFNKYIDDINTHPSHRLGFIDLTYKEYEKTKQDLFEYMNMDKDTYKEESQILSGIILLLNTEDNIKIMEEWLKIITLDNQHYANSTPGKSPNHPGFICHLHDQSILSLLYKKYGFCKEDCIGTHIPKYSDCLSPKRFLPFHPSWKRSC
jgi:hypothetical protein